MYVYAGMPFTVDKNKSIKPCAEMAWVHMPQFLCCKDVKATYF